MEIFSMPFEKDNRLVANVPEGADYVRVVGYENNRGSSRKIEWKGLEFYSEQDARQAFGYDLDNPSFRSKEGIEKLDRLFPKPAERKGRKLVFLREPNGHATYYYLNALLDSS